MPSPSHPTNIQETENRQMRQLEGLLGIIAALLFAATGVLGAVWIGMAAYMVVKGAPNSTRTELATMAASASEPATSQSETAGSMTAEASSAEVAEVAVSADKGAKVFKKCKACHVAEAAGKNKTGPNLWNVIGRQIASAEGFKYSEALAGKSGESWSVDVLKAFLANPKKYVPGTSMSFAGLKKEADAANLIAYLGLQSDAPQDAVALGLGAVAAAASDEDETAAAEEAVEIDPVPYPEGVTYANPPERTAEAQAAVDARVAELTALVPTLDYERARFHPIHFPPAIAEASNEECLVCHQEIMDYKPRVASPVGIAASDTLAWYQTLDTYSGAQESFHYRHLVSDYAQSVMNLECNFCHKGNDTREETPDMMSSRAAYSTPATPEFTLRKMVNPSETCLRCHGAMPDPVEIMGLDGPWHEVRGDIEYAEAPNGCMSCHAETFRTVRHGVDYLKAENIEKIGREGSSDSCYGCHGGRSWYRISYPYPRHDWPDMDTEVPTWAETRATQSDPEYAMPKAAE